MKRRTKVNIIDNTITSFIIIIMITVIIVIHIINFAIVVLMSFREEWFYY